MSTMRVTNLKHESSASNNIVLNSDGSVGGDLGSTLASKLAAADQTVVQIVRGTATGNVSTTSSSLVDITGLSVSITPTSASNAILIVISVFVNAASVGDRVEVAITDSSNNVINGTERGQVANGAEQTIHTGIAYATPATTSAVTYKGRFKVIGGGTGNIRNDLNTGQLYAIEVSP